MDSESIETLIESKPSSSSISASASASASNGDKCFPPGFRFHPTDEELILYYLKRKICGRSLKLDIIADVDVYKCDPHDLPGQSKWKTGDRQWFFFSSRDKKYRGRAQRATMHGYWKATGKDRIINCNSRAVGIKKTLIYYQGRAPSGQRTDWVIHEYTLGEDELKSCRFVKEYYALNKVFKKSGAGPKNGEQYGAIFVEEEWEDDVECLDVVALSVQNMNSVVNEDKLAVGTNHEPLQVHLGSDLAQSANEPFRISSVELEPLVVNDDFLELDDLGTPPIPLPVDLEFADFDGFSAFDLYNDSNEINPFEGQQSQQPFWENFAITEFQTGYDLWTHDQINNNIADAQATDGVAVSAPSVFLGVISNEKPKKPDSGVNESLKTGEDDGSDSWFSSALWAYVESVPTSPASAMESNVIVNKAFEKMNTADSTLVNTRVGGSSRTNSTASIVFFSLLGVLLALLYVFVGTSIELLGRFVI